VEKEMEISLIITNIFELSRLPGENDQLNPIPLGKATSKMCRFSESKTTLS